MSASVFVFVLRKWRNDVVLSTDADELKARRGRKGGLLTLKRGIDRWGKALSNAKSQIENRCRQRR